MSFSQDSSAELTSKIPVKLSDDSILMVEVAQTGKQDVAFKALPFKQVTESISELSKDIGELVAKAQPTKATVKYGIELGIEQGSLVAALVRGTGKANLEITLEWEKPKSSDPKTES